ncbi:MAG: alpha-amylase family glycosyl hydrolase [Planctomycetota bacterium]
MDVASKSNRSLDGGHALGRALTLGLGIGLIAALGLVIAPPDTADGQLLVAESAPSAEDRYGAHLDADGWVHFGVFAPDAESVELLLYGDARATEPQEVVPMEGNGTDWRIKLRGERIGHGLLYLYRATGPRDVSLTDQYGHFFNPAYPLNDPYAYDTQNVAFSEFFSGVPLVDAEVARYAGGGKSIVYDHARDDHPGHLRVACEDLIVYELHVQDFTARIASLDESKRGTYVGLATPGLKTPGGLAAGIDHLVELGITAVELMPVMEYDEETGNAAGRLNHWGYMTTNFFAPETRYAADPGNDVVELKHLVKAFHERGIAVLIDAVYNHTGEQSSFEQDGQLAAKYYNLRGLCNRHVYKTTGDDRFYFNNSGTGNDVNFSGPDDSFAKRWATESLELWHKVYGVDGFRFDLARILADGSHNAADWVDNDEDFVEAHLHAEPWDLGGAWFDFMDNFGFGHHNNRWAKWIGRYRDSIRLFSKSTLTNRTRFKRLIEGRGDAGGGAPASTRPWRSVNLLAVHDGYTLRDCVTFNDEGGSHNAWDSDGDENLRREREKLMLGILLTSQGVPLLLQGDEFGRSKATAASQTDAHNTYNYESTVGDTAINYVNWIDWRLKDGDTSRSPGGPAYGGELFRWTRNLIALRKRWSHFRHEEFSQYAPQATNGGVDAGAANDGRYTYSWEGGDDGEATQLAVIWWGRESEPDLMVIYNEDHAPFTVGNLADWSKGDWQVMARSWFGDGHDFAELDNWTSTAPEAGGALNINGRSMAILISDND